MKNKNGIPILPSFKKKLVVVQPVVRKRVDETAVFKHADESVVFVNRGTSGTVPLKKYGRPNSFVLAVAEKLATTGLTEAEFVKMAHNFKTDVKRFKAHIRYFEKEGFQFVLLENGRYLQK